MATKSKTREPEPIEFSNEQKVMFPDVGVTKGDVIAFYQQIADRLLPFLKDRPVTLERLPEGLTGPKAPHFWQKNTPTYYPSWIPRARMKTEEGKTVEYAIVNDVQTLLYLVNQGTVTFHVWFSRIDDPERPDFVLFDLDPGKAPFERVVQIARTTHEVLAERGVADAIVKTSGKTGLHVLAPWTRDGDHDAARAWAVEVAEEVVKRLPEIATTERSKARRRGRVYYDVMQNAKGRHAVPPYVLRVVPDAGVSTPLRWNELTDDLSPRDFNITSIFPRLRRLKKDPIAPLLSRL